MKKNRRFCLILCVILLLQTVTTAAFATDETQNISILQGCHSVDAQVPVLGTSRMFENAESALAYETGTDTLMYAWNPDQQIYPASMVKLMTALIVIEQANMTDVVTVTADVLATLPDSAMSAELKENEVLSVEDLLYCMLVGSANDAAAVLAVFTGGNQDAFVAKMNENAAELGCAQTQFTDPHGLSSEQYSTARDMARILAAAMKNEQFRTIFCTAEYTVKATNKSDARKLETVNLMMDPDSALYYDARVIGGRTGTGTSGDRCIAAVSLSGDLQIISIITGAQSVYRDDGYTVTTIGGYNETKTLLDACYSGYKSVQVIYEGQALKQYSVKDGNADLVIGPQISVSTILPSDAQKASLTYRYNDTANGFNAPVEKNKKVSTVEIWNGSVCVAQADLFAMNAVEIKQNQSIDTQDVKERSFVAAVLLVIITVIGTAFAVLLALRLISTLRMRAAQKRSRRYRRNRRRSY